VYPYEYLVQDVNTTSQWWVTEDQLNPVPFG